MLTSDIVFKLNQSVNDLNDPTTKLGKAYCAARKDLEKMELELKRPKILIVDKHGRLTAQSLIIEH